MHFVSYCFTTGPYSLDTTPLLSDHITSVALSNGAFDNLFVTTDSNQPYTPGSPGVWDFDTVLYAEFQGNTSSGNVDFWIDNTDYLLIKRRIKGTFNWEPLYIQPIHTAQDATFTKVDNTVRGNTEYEYAIVPVSGSTEGNYIILGIKTCFTGLFITGADRYFSTNAEVDFNSQQQNKAVAVVEPLGRNFPFVISNGNANYKSGTVSAVFLEKDGSALGYNAQKQWEYLESLAHFLNNGKPKLIKYEDGRLRLANISTNTIDESSQTRNSPIATSFGWTEIGNGDLAQYLYKNGFTDVPSAPWTPTTGG